MKRYIANEKINQILDEMSEQLDRAEEEYQKFKDSKAYLQVLEQLTGQSIDNEDRDWTDEVQQLFDFIYYNGINISPLRAYGEDVDEFTLQYKEHYWIFFQVYGQGCYECIASTDDYTEEILANVVSLEDIEKYTETGIKPLKIQAIELIQVGLNNLEHFSRIYDINYKQHATIDEIKHYIRENLK